MLKCLIWSFQKLGFFYNRSLLLFRLIPFPESVLNQELIFEFFKVISLFSYQCSKRDCLANAEGGIRTLVPSRTNGFQDRLVMTTSIPLHIKLYQTTQIGLEPTTFAVTGRRSNQLSHWAIYKNMKN